MALVILGSVPVLGASGWLTDDPPYYVPSAGNVEITPILTVGEGVGGYEMVGIPDGLGAFDNRVSGEHGGGLAMGGTFTVLMNHELAATSGATRDHGSTGAFVSRWVLRTSDLSVVSGDDQIKRVFLDNGAGGWTGPASWAFERLCSADLPAQSAFFNAATGRGTTELIFMDGEETRPPFTSAGVVRYGKGFAHIVSGGQNGESYELNDVGEMSFENVVASPFPQDKTVVVSLDDSTNSFATTPDPSNPPSEVYVYVGEKSATGNPIQRAGLVGGALFGVKVPGHPTEDTIAASAPFQLHAMTPGAQDDGFVLQNESIAQGVTQFRRVEDGQWDPTSPNDFYYTTTDAFGGRTSVWRLRFADVTDPAAGGTITRVYTSTPGTTAPEAFPGEMFDNMTVDSRGRVLLQEDTGNQAYLSRIWALNPDNGRIGELAIHNPALFAPPAVITQDEESSGIIDISHIVGRTTYLLDVQAHVSAGDPELVERGQLLGMTVKFQKLRDQSGALVFP
jgi:hypothetical protein